MYEAFFFSGIHLVWSGMKQRIKEVLKMLEIEIENNVWCFLRFKNFGAVNK